MPAMTDISQAVELMRPSIVQIGVLALWRPIKARREGIPFHHLAVGTGFLVGGKYVVTARHVVEAAYRTAAQIEAEKTAREVSVHVGFPSATNETYRGIFSLEAFDVAETDEVHDLALLKLLRDPIVSPLPDEKEPKSSQEHSPVVLYSERPVDGVAIGVSGYPLDESVLITNAGYLASGWARVKEEASTEEDSYVRHDRYLGDVVANPGNSGGPVYLADKAWVIGVCVAGRQTTTSDDAGQPIPEVLQKSGITVIVPSTYVVEMLERHDVPFQTAPTERKHDGISEAT